MNCGKAIAQGSHASNAFVHHFHQYMQNTSATPIEEIDEVESMNKAFYEWENATSQGFGTVIVLEGNIGQIKKTIDMSVELGYISGIVHDPTYPILDGNTVHHIPLDTCGYVFVKDKDTDYHAKYILGDYILHH